ncbi:MAG TPA: XisI protein [Caldilineaceae bacterium]|nr:XisI protein [Caldilineaceae bacterium]
MDPVKKYATLVKEALNHYADLITKEPNPHYELVRLFDDEHHQYMLRKVGWNQSGRIKYIPLHVALRNNKIWIEEDWTEDGIATYFLEKGVPPEDIVLGFYKPETRADTEFAVA